MTDFNIRVILNPAPAVAGARTVRGELAKTEGAATRLNKLFTRVFQFAGLGFGLNQLRKFGDSFLELQNRLRIAGFETDALAGATQRLIDISNKTRSPLDANARLLGRIGIAAKDLGATQEELFQFVELTGKGLAIQGSSAQEARGALTQLAQALGSGIVRAEEFNSISEGAVPILQAVAAAMGTTVSGLRKLVIAGKVTSQQFFRALLDSGQSLETLFQNVAPTIGQALIVLENQFIALTGTLESNFGGVLSTISRSILLFANSLQIVVPLLLDLAGAIVAVKFAIFAQSVFAILPAITSFGRGLRVAATIIPGVAGAMRILNAVLLVNPFILIASAIGLAITLILQFGSAVKLTADGSVTLATALQFVINIVSALAGVIGSGLLIILQGLGTVISSVAQGVIILVTQGFGPLFNLMGPFTAVLLAAGAAFLGIVSPVTAIVAAFLSLIPLVFQFQDVIVSIFPPAQAFFDFMNTALEVAIQFWEGLVRIVKEAGQAFGLFEGNVQDVTKALDQAGSAAGAMGDNTVKAATKSASALRAVSGSARGIASDFASASNSASSSLNTLANNAASVASSIRSSMASAASSVASAGGGGGRGLVGTGSGTRIDTGGSKTATFGVSGTLKRIAAALGGTAGVKSAGITPQGGFKIEFGIKDTDTFSKEAQQNLTRQAIQATGAAPTGAQQAIISQLAQVTQNLKQQQNISTLSEFDKQKAQGKFGIGGLGGGQQSITELLVQQKKLQDQFTKSIAPPAAALQTAAVSLQTASSDLSNLANSPIFLTGNPFEAFRQNVFGFAKGGTFDVPGQGGPDSKLVKLALTPGEQVNIKTKAQQKDDEKDAGTVINQNVTYNIETQDADSFGRNQTQIVGKTLNTLSRVQRRL